MEGLLARAALLVFFGWVRGSMPSVFLQSGGDFGQSDRFFSISPRFPQESNGSVEFTIAKCINGLGISPPPKFGFLCRERHFCRRFDHGTLDPVPFYPEGVQAT